METSKGLEQRTRFNQVNVEQQHDLQNALLYW